MSSRVQRVQVLVFNFKSLHDGLNYPVWSCLQRVQVVVSCTSTIYSMDLTSSAESCSKSPVGCFLYVKIYSMDEAIQYGVVFTESKR